MKRFILFIAIILSSSFAIEAMAQEVVVVDSERVFKSLEEYTSALEQVDVLSQKYQADVDAKFAAVSEAFNEYALSKSNLSAPQRIATEAKILKMEEEATSLQERYFAQDGVIINLRLSLIAPIQKRVFSTIESYAKQVGADIVLDKASNPSILFAGERVDCTEAVIELLNK